MNADLSTWKALFHKGIITSLFFIVVPRAFGQVDSALGFFPLHTGDLRQYIYQRTWTSCPPGPHTDSLYGVEKIVGDTILPTGFTYKIIQNNILFEPPVSFLRIDTATANVYTYVDYPTPGERLVDSLRATPGSTFGSEYQRTECTGVDTVMIFGAKRIVKYFLIYTIPYQYYTLAYGLGMLQFSTYEDGACYPTFDRLSFDLTYAQIDSQHYGAFVDVVEPLNTVPASFTLAQNYPNPFNPSTVIFFSVPTNSHVTLTIYDFLGKKITALVDEQKVPGGYSVRWQAQGLVSGIYYYRLRAGSFFETKKLMLIK